jgi:hypothetical protein
MVFAPGCDLGRARVFQCNLTVSSKEELVREAQALWLAESPDGSGRQPTETLSGGWGCVALLANERSNVPQRLLSGWAERVSQERFDQARKPSYDRRRYSVMGVSVITDRGELAIDWPHRADTGEALTGVDLLLATATQPTPYGETGDHAPVPVIAEAWNRTKNATYFHSNRANGFHTFQDDAIEALLRV